MNPQTSDKATAGGQLRIRVMTYNIHSCVDQNRTVNCDKFLKIIGERNADIVALQEVNAQKPFAGNRNQAGIIADKLKMDHIFFPAENAGLRAFGLAILSRFAIIESHHNLLPNLYPRLNPRKRGAVRASLQTPAGSLNVINAHLSLFKAERPKQLKTLLGRDWLSALPEDEPVILCGDMNAGPLSRTYRSLCRHLTDVQKKVKGPGRVVSQPTFHSRSPLFRIDHIFVSRHFHILNVEVTKTPDTQTASDHLPLTADLVIN
jgi:endonuclease/exonuclease/phosphatase family metal-dependent hydrolase